MKQSKAIMGLILALLVLTLVGGGSLAFYLIRQNQQLAAQLATSTTPEAAPTVRPQSSPTIVLMGSPTSVPTPTSAVPAGWQTYTSSEYGFSISYPADWQALDDPNNLYGWPNGVALLYNGGQAYDIAIEVWDNLADFQAKYNNLNMTSATYNLPDGRVLSVVDQTGEPNNSQIMATFSLN